MKKILFICCLVTLLGGGCLKGPGLPEKQFISQQREKCFELGLRYKKDEETEIKDGSILKPIFGYSEERRTCLYVGGILDAHSTQEYVIDLLTNQAVAEYMIFRGENVLGNKVDFQNEKARFDNEIKSQINLRKN